MPVPFAINQTACYIRTDPAFFNLVRQRPVHEPGSASHLIKYQHFGIWQSHGTLPFPYL